jgi:hypothetical protein
MLNHLFNGQHKVDMNRLTTDPFHSISFYLVTALALVVLTIGSLVILGILFSIESILP